MTVIELKMYCNKHSTDSEMKNKGLSMTSREAVIETLCSYTEMLLLFVIYTTKRGLATEMLV